MIPQPIIIKYFDRWNGNQSNMDEIVSISETKIVIGTDEPNRFMVFTGTGLEVEDGVFVGGTIDSMSLVDQKDRPLTIATGLYSDMIGADATSIQGILTAATGNKEFRDTIVIGTDSDDDHLTTASGDDILRGRKGNDVLEGGEGNDRLFGGNGNDVFVFNTGDGQDTIMDFDATHAGGQDLIRADFEDVIDIYRDGKNTVIDFDNGDTLTLIGIKPNQINEHDFQFLT